MIKQMTQRTYLAALAWTRHHRSYNYALQMALLVAGIALVSCQVAGTSVDPPPSLGPTQTTVAASATPTLLPTATTTHTLTSTPHPSATPVASPTPTATASPTATNSPTPTPTPWPERRYLMTYEIEHPTRLGTQQLVEKLWLPLPNTDGDGTVEFELIEVYPNNHKILEIGEANRAVYWEDVPILCQQTDCIFGARFYVSLELPVYTIPWGDAVSYETESDLYRMYTMPQRGIQSDDPALRQLAQEIVAEEPDVFKQVLLLQSWVGQNIQYPELGSTYPDDALLCLDQGVGDCAGQSKILVALARAVGIPARTVSGLLPFERSVGQLERFEPRITWFDQTLSVHVWVEIYFPQLGWVQLEPDLPGFGVNKERLITKRGPFAFPNGLCRQATYFHLPLAVQGDWCGQSVGWEVSIDAQRIE